MPAGTVIDYSGSRPTDQVLQQMRAAGIIGVVRYPYLGPGTEWKAIQRSEFEHLASWGFSIALTPELAANTWTLGKTKGIEIGKMARDWARSIGFPDSQCMHFAVDTDVSPGQLSTALNFLEGCSQGSGRLESAYGETSVIDGAFERGITCNAWRSASTAWDSNASKHASMRQTTQRTYPLPISYDENIVTGPNWGQHNYSGDIMATPFTLWQTDPGTAQAKIWRVDAAGQSRVQVPDLQQVAFNFDRLKEYGEPNPGIRDAVGEARRWIDAIPLSGSVILPPLPPYPVPPTVAEISAGTKALLNQQKITVP